MTTETEVLRRYALHRSNRDRSAVIDGRLVDLTPAHPGQFADCLICTPRTTGRSLPNYRRHQ